MPVYFFDESDTTSPKNAQRAIYTIGGLRVPYRVLEELEAGYWEFKQRKGSLHIQEVKEATGTKYDPAQEMLAILSRYRAEVLYCYGDKEEYTRRPESLRRKHLVQIISWIAVNDGGAMPLVFFDRRGKKLDNDDAEVIGSLYPAYPGRIPNFAHLDSVRCIGLQFAHHVVAAVRKHYAGVSSDGYRQIATLVRMGLCVG